MVHSRATTAQAKVKKRIMREAKMRSALESGWRFIDSKETYQLPALPESLERATLAFRGDSVTLFQILKRILTSVLLNDRLANPATSKWRVFKSICKMHLSLLCHLLSYSREVCQVK